MFLSERSAEHELYIFKLLIKIKVAIKFSWAISRVNVRLKTNVSDTISLSISRVYVYQDTVEL
jgi:hypothetical protein